MLAVYNRWAIVACNSGPVIPTMGCFWLHSQMWKFSTLRDVPAQVTLARRQQSQFRAQLAAPVRRTWAPGPPWVPLFLRHQAELSQSRGRGSVCLHWGPLTSLSENPCCWVFLRPEVGSTAEGQREHGYVPAVKVMVSLFQLPSQQRQLLGPGCHNPLLPASDGFSVDIQQGSAGQSGAAQL